MSNKKKRKKGRPLLGNSKKIVKAIRVEERFLEKIFESGLTLQKLIDSFLKSWINGTKKD